MRETQRGIISTGIISEDEIDDLFKKLDQLEPPPYLITRILTAVSLLPLPLPLATPLLWDELDGLVVRNNGKERC